MDTHFWNQKTVLITGASSGIGEAIYHLLKPHIAKAILVSRRQMPGEPDSIACDIADSESVEKAIAEVQKRIGDGNIDVFFNNAGITAHGRFDSTKMQVFRKTFDTNFFGPIQLIQGLLPFLVRSKGTVVSTSTVSGLYGVPGRSAYSSSKAALHAVMEAFRVEMRDSGVRSVIVCPPYTKTNLRTSGLNADGSTLSEPQAGGKIKTPQEVAHSIIKAVENPKSRLVTIDKSGFAMKVLRLLSPETLENIMYKKLYNDFH